MDRVKTWAVYNKIDSVVSIATIKTYQFKYLIQKGTTKLSV